MYHHKIRNFECWALSPPRWKEGKIITPFHRIDGPAIILTEPNTQIRTEEYWQNGSLFRSNGPAIIVYDSMNRIVNYTWHKSHNEIQDWMSRNNITLSGNNLTLPEKDALIFRLRFI